MATLPKPDGDDAPPAKGEGESTQFQPTQALLDDDGEGTVPHHPPRAAAAASSLDSSAWRHNPLVWVLLVVAMFLSVPLLSECSMGARRDRAAAKPAAPAPASTAEAAAPAVVEPVAPVSTAPARPPSLATPKSTPPRPAAESRQMVTKCIERGRVVYTQTGECAGSVTAVPIDADKNVIGNEGAPATPKR